MDILQTVASAMQHLGRPATSADIDNIAHSMVKEFAKDGVTYKDAEDSIYSLEHILGKTKEVLHEAAAKEVSMSPNPVKYLF